jgi:hypothetical protein
VTQEVDVAVAGPLLAVRIVNPLHVLGNRISVSDIDGLQTFKLCEHPEIWKETIEGNKGAQHPEIRPQIEAMKTQVIEYQALAASIKSFEEGRIARGRTRSTCLVGTFLSDARYAFTLKHMPMVHQLRLRQRKSMWLWQRE